MEISLELLMEFLQSIEWMEASCPNVIAPFEKTAVSDVALLPTGNAQLSQNILWCGFLSNILTMDRTLREGRSFLALGVESEFEAISHAQDCNCIFFPQRIGLPAIFNETASVFRRLHKWECQIDLAIARRESIQKLVDISEPLMGNPLVVFSDSFEIQAYSRNHVIDKPPLQNVLKAGRFSGEDLEIIAKMNYLRESDQFSTLKLCYPPNWANCHFAMRLFMEGQKAVVTMVEYFLNSPPTLGQLEFLHMFEVKFENYVKHVLSTGQRSKSYIYQPFIINLIDGHMSRKEDILDSLHAINLPFEAKYRLFEFRFEKFTPPLAWYARNNCKSIFPYAKLVVHHEALFMLDREGCQSEKNDLKEYRKKNLNNLLEICCAYCGISETVPNLTCVHTAYLQTESALKIRELMDPEQRIWYFHDAYFWDIIDCYTSQCGINANCLYYHPLDHLIEHDRATGNNNLHLLDVYLNCDRNITNTAKVMNLHRNSVIYRLDRMEKMLNGSFNDPKFRFDLLISLKILQYIERKNK